MVSNDSNTGGVDCLLNCFERAKDEMAKLNQRWENRLTFEGCSLREEYRKGRLSIVCYLDLRTCNDATNNPSVLRDFESNTFEGIAILIVSADSAQPNDAQNGQDEHVLIDDVNLMKGEQASIPSIFRMYLVGETITNALRGNLYASTVDGSYCFLFSASDWEPGMRANTLVVMGKDFTVENIQGSTEVVDRIAQNKWNDFRQRLFLASQNVVPIRITIGTKSAGIILDEHIHDTVKVVDMLIGSFDL